MKNKIKYIVGIVGSLFLFSCEQEIARVDLINDNSKEIVFELKKDETINFYTEMNIEYKEKPLFVFNCEAYYENSQLFQGGTDPLVTLENKNDKQDVINGVTHWKFFGKLDGDLKAIQDGKYTIKTTFIKNSEKGLKINKVEIVFIKQGYHFFNF